MSLSIYYVILPDGQEFAKEINKDCSSYDTPIQDFIDCTVRNSGLRTSRKNPQKIEVRVEKTVVSDGKVKRVPTFKLQVMPPLARMTEDEYLEAMKEAVSDLPKEFADYVTSEAYDRGHSAGYEEVVSIASGMAYTLLPVVKAFVARLLTEKEKARR